MISFFQVIPLMSVSTNSYFPLGKLPIAVSSTVRVALLPSGITRLCLPGADTNQERTVYIDTFNAINTE